MGGLLAGLGGLGGQIAISAASRVANGMQQAVGGFSGIYGTGNGLPPTEFGQVTAWSTRNALGYFDQKYSSGAALNQGFGGGVAGMNAMAAAASGLRDQLNKIGISQVEFLGAMKAIGSASGQTGQALAKATKDVLDFSRATSVSFEALRQTDRAMRAVGISAVALGGMLDSAGITNDQKEETMLALGGLQSAYSSKGISDPRITQGFVGGVSALQRFGSKYEGADAVNFMGALAGSWNTNGPMSAILAASGSNFLEFQAGRESPTGANLKRVVDTLREWGPDVTGAMNLPLSYNQRLDLFKRNKDGAYTFDSDALVKTWGGSVGKGSDFTNPIEGQIKRAIDASLGAGTPIVQAYAQFTKDTDAFKSATSLYVNAIKNGIFPGGMEGRVLANKLIGGGESPSYSAAKVGSGGPTYADMHPNSGIRVKDKSVVLRPGTPGYLIAQVAAFKGFMVTSGTDGKHLKGSQHYDGNADDFRMINGKSGDTTALKELFHGTGVDVQFHPKGYKGAEADHMHLQLAAGTNVSAVMSKLAGRIEQLNTTMSGRIPASDSSTVGRKR